MRKLRSNPTHDKLTLVEHRLVLGALVTAALYGVMFVLTAIPRFLYSYDLNLIEDGLLMTALREATGQPVFIAPQAEFTPHVYMPLYTWLGGLLFTTLRKLRRELLFRG